MNFIEKFEKYCAFLNTDESKDFNPMNTETCRRFIGKDCTSEEVLYFFYHFKEIKQAIEIIGTNVKIYGHFKIYSVPNENQVGISNNEDMKIVDFLAKITNYYNNKKLLNLDYGDDLKDQNATKRFILKNIDDSSLEEGFNYIKKTYVNRFLDF